MIILISHENFRIQYLLCEKNQIEDMWYNCSDRLLFRQLSVSLLFPCKPLKSICSFKLSAHHQNSFQHKRNSTFLRNQNSKPIVWNQNQQNKTSKLKQVNQSKNANMCKSNICKIKQTIRNESPKYVYIICITGCMKWCEKRYGYEVSN